MNIWIYLECNTMRIFNSIHLISLDETKTRIFCFICLFVCSGNWEWMPALHSLWTGHFQHTHTFKFRQKKVTLNATDALANDFRPTNKNIHLKWQMPYRKVSKMALSHHLYINEPMRYFRLTKTSFCLLFFLLLFYFLH